MPDSNQWPSRFLDLKRDLVSATTEERLTASWNDVLNELGKRTAEIAKAGSNSIPQVNFADLDKLTPEEIDDIKSKGAVVIHGIVDSEIASGWKKGLDEFVKANPHAGGIPEDDKQFWDLFYTQPQTQARTHPNYIKAATVTWINKLFYIGSGKTIEGVDLSIPLIYADRFRMRHPGTHWSWFGAHIDGGGVERWEDKTWSTCYKDIFEGNWRQHDAYDAEHRVNAHRYMYAQLGMNTVLRNFQGWMALNEIAPTQGTLQVFPDVKLSNAYIMLRPFFSPTVSSDSPDFLDAKNWKFDISTPEFPGIQPTDNGGFSGPFLSNELHPHLKFDETLISIPKVKPGDMVFWHCDTIHAVETEHTGTEDSTVLYMPAIGKTPYNLQYVTDQAKLFLEGRTPPDSGKNPETEMFVGIATQADITNPISRAALMLPIEVA